MMRRSCVLELDLSADFDDAQRGFIATLPDGVVAGPAGRPAFDAKRYAFLSKDDGRSWKIADIDERLAGGHQLFACLNVFRGSD
jgi:alkyl sulfatase BDS1-like metallo-beta-lactamase superfamily hydrolase